MSFRYDYAFRNGETFTDAQLSITSRERDGEVTPNALLTLWRDEPETAAMVSSASDGLTVVSLGDIQTVTISKKD